MKRKGKLISLAPSLLYLLMGIASCLTASAQPLSFSNYTTDDGLPHDVCFHVMQDSRGYLWVATDQGISRFDGQQFRNYSRSDGLSSNFAIQLAEGPDSALYAAMWGGGVCRIKNDSVEVLELPFNFGQKFNGVRVKEDALWVWGDYTLIRYPLGAFHPDSAQAFRLYKEPGNDQLQFGKIPRKRGKRKNRESYPTIFFARYDWIGNQMIAYYGLPGLYAIGQEESLYPLWEPLIQGDTIWGVQQTRDGDVWLGGRGLLVHIRPDGSHKRYEGLPPYPIRFIRQIGKKRVAFCTANESRIGKGVLLLHTETGELRNLGEEIGGLTYPNWIELDKEGNLWVATYGEGLYCIHRTSFDPIPQKELGKINDLFGYGPHEVLAATSNGLLALDHEGEVLSTLQPNSAINDIFSWQQNILFSTEKQMLLTSFPEGTVYEQTSVGHRFFTKGDSLFTYSTQQIVLLRSPDPSSGPLPILADFDSVTLYHAIALPENRYAIASNQGVWVIRFIPGNKGMEILRHFSRRNGLCDDQVNYLLFDRQERLWMATEKGLSVLEDGKLRCIGREHGLLFENCIRLLEDHRGGLWIGSLQGLEYYADGEFWGMNKQTGLLANDVSSLYEGPENTLWVGSSRGITWLDNRQKPQRRPPPPFEISYSNLQAGKRYPIGRNFRVEVKGLCYYAPRSLRYQYRLDNGLWLPMESPFLDLKGLNRGSHTLRLRARTLESYWSATEVIPFEILAWWQQAFWWGLLVGGLVLSLLIGLLVRRRIRRFKRLNDRLEEEIQNRKQTESRLEKVRTQVAKDFHDEVGNKLASITVLANLAKLHLKSDPPELSPLLNRIEDQSKSLHAATRDFIWSIDSQSDYLKELFFYLRDFGSEFFEGLEVSFYVEGNGVENSELKLLPSWSRHIHLIFKEAMTNVVRHTNSQQVWLRFRLSEKRLWICLENDKGEGPIEPHPQGKGLRSMRERAALLDADLSITPRRVELRLPIPQDGGTIPPK